MYMYMYMIYTILTDICTCVCFALFGFCFIYVCIYMYWYMYIYMYILSGFRTHDVCTEKTEIRGLKLVGKIPNRENSLKVCLKKSSKKVFQQRSGLWGPENKFVLDMWSALIIFRGLKLFISSKSCYFFNVSNLE